MHVAIALGAVLALPSQAGGTAAQDNLPSTNEVCLPDGVAARSGCPQPDAVTRANRLRIPASCSRMIRRPQLYMGVNLLWLIALGLLVVMGEIRVGWVKKSVLKPFGFMHT